jgi:hypothetical protein
MREQRIGSVLLVFIACGCGGSAPGRVSSPARRSLLAQAGEGEAPAPAAEPGPPAADGEVVSDVATEPVVKEQVVVEGWIELEVEDAAGAAQALALAVDKAGGRIVREQVTGAADSWRASIELRLPPAEVEALLAWLAVQGEITSKRIEANDVSRTLFDQELALENLRVTLERLRKLLAAGGLSMQDILAVEKELTRLRGEIERIEGEKRFLEDRVALATLRVEIARRGGAVLRAKTKLYPGPKLSALTLFAPDGRRRTRLGGGVALHTAIPRISLELEVFDDAPATAEHPREKHAVIATWGGAMYSDHLGAGGRRWLNPYIGFRLGYGYLDYHSFVLQAEAGVELFKHDFLLIDASVRATGFLGSDNVDGGLVSSASIVFAF